MPGYVTNIEEATTDNEFFRKVLFTASHSQLVVMALQPNEDIGEEVHPHLDQFIRVESGEGRAVLDGEEYDLTADSAIVIPAGTRHNVINTSQAEALKLYTVYSPPQHADGTIHETKADAEAAEAAEHARS